MATLNWLRIGGNALTAFFTVLAALTFAQISTDNTIYAAFWGAIIQAGLSVGKDLKDQADKREPSRFLFGVY